MVRPSNSNGQLTNRGQGQDGPGGESGKGGWMQLWEGRRDQARKTMRYKGGTWSFVWGHGRCSADTYTNSVCWRPNPRTPLGASPSKPQIQDRSAPDNEIYVSACSRPNYIWQKGPVRHLGEKKGHVSRGKRPGRYIYVVTALPRVDPHQTCSWSVGDSRKRSHGFWPQEIHNLGEGTKCTYTKQQTAVTLLGLLTWTQ